MVQPDPFFLKCNDEELAKWKDSYETLIRDNTPGAGKTCMLPHLVPSWKNGLEVKNKIISDRAKAGKQLTIF